MAILLKDFDPMAMFVWLRDTTYAGKECKRGEIVAKNEIGGVRKLMQLYMARKLGYPFQLTDKVGSLGISDEGAKMGLLDSLKKAGKELLKEKANEAVDNLAEKAKEKAVELVEDKLKGKSQPKKK